MVKKLNDNEGSQPRKRQGAARDDRRADMPPALLRLLVNEAQKNGPPPASLLRGSGLEPADLNSAQLRISYHQYAEVVRRFLAARPSLSAAVQIGNRVNILSLSKVALGLMASENHQHMLDFLVEFQRAAGFAMGLSLYISAPLQQIQVEVVPRFDDPDIEPFLSLFTIAVLNQLIRQVLGPNFHPVRILLAQPRPPDVFEYEMALGSRISFGARTSMLCLPLEPVSIPAAEPSVVERMRELLAAGNAVLHFEHGTAVMQIIRRVQAAAPPLAQIAAALNISERTLRRKLQEEGLTYRGLINEHRRQRTIALLVQSSTPMTEVASQTGYSSPRSLRRAVQRWTGSGPSNVRRSLEPGAQQDWRLSAGQSKAKEKKTETPPARSRRMPAPAQHPIHRQDHTLTTISTAAIDATRYDAAIVDLDGTMIDTLGDFSEALNRMLRDLALPAIGAQDIERMVGKGSEHLLRSVLQHVLGPADGAHAESLYPAAWEAYQRHYLALNGQYANTYPGVEAGLRALRGAGLQLACLTNKPTAFAVPLLQAKGLDGFFGHVFGGDAFERKKPDPLPLLKTCEALGTTPARTLMIGDSSNDAQAARAAGCPVVLVTYGYNHGQSAHSVDADGYVDALTELATG